MNDFSVEVIDLRPIYDFISQPENREIPGRDEPVYLRYRDVVDGLLQQVPKGPGWYAWFARGRQADNQSVKYVGQSSSYGLFNRLRDELREDYLAFWGTAYDMEQMLQAMMEIYPDYQANHMRVAMRAGATHLMAVGLPSATRGELDVVEYKLIQEFAPLANADRRDYSRVCVPIYRDVLDIFRESLA
ncbi:MAG: hypothetical protein M1376_20945 [Planctomycetes bacterium]|nr:hypothetical protein [Planctomycetota bacterium]